MKLLQKNVEETLVKAIKMKYVVLSHDLSKRGYKSAVKIVVSRN